MLTAERREGERSYKLTRRPRHHHLYGKSILLQAANQFRGQLTMKDLFFSRLKRDRQDWPYGFWVTFALIGVGITLFYVFVALLFL